MYMCIYVYMSLQSRFCEDALSRIAPRPFFQRRTPVDFQRFFNDFGSFFGPRPSIHYGAEPTTSLQSGQRLYHRKKGYVRP